MQDKNNIRQYSRKLRPHGTLAENLRLLAEFANLREERAEKFREQHPEFLLLPQLRESGWEFGVMNRLGMTARAAQRAREIADEQANPVLRKRDVLRRVWKGDEYANDYLKLLLYSSGADDRIEFNWKRGEIVYEPKDDLERAVYALFRNSRLAKVCEAEDCPAPYFIAQRKNQRYCSEDCAVQFQKKWKRDWWEREGSRRRQEQRTAKTANSGKRGKR